MSKDILGKKNPNWKGGLLEKVCQICGIKYQVKRVHKNSKFFSLQCVGKSQRGKQSTNNKKLGFKKCEVCDKEFSAPLSHIKRHKCCSKECSFKNRALKVQGEGNPNWCGGLSKQPYTYNFYRISRDIIKYYEGKCQNPSCAGSDKRMTTHHIDYDKTNNNFSNLIALCSACNSKANFKRLEWQKMYQKIKKKDGGGWQFEEFAE